jgi:hypothetical protein
MARWKGHTSAAKVSGGSTIAPASTRVRVRRGESEMRVREQGNVARSCARPGLTSGAIAVVRLQCDGRGLWPVGHNVV